MSKRKGSIFGLPDSHLYLLGDIGGTNLRLELRDSKNKLLHRRDRKTQEYSSMSEALKDFFSSYSIEVDHRTIWACISIAARVKDDKVVAQSNISWTMTKGADVKTEFGKFSLLTQSSKNSFFSTISKLVGILFRSWILKILFN